MATTSNNETRELFTEQEIERKQQEWIESSYFQPKMSRNSVLVNGYIKSITLNIYIPIDIRTLCERFNYINISGYILPHVAISKKLTSQGFLNYITNSLKNRNYLLAKELLLYRLSDEQIVISNKDNINDEHRYYLQLANCYEEMRLFDLAEHYFKLTMKTSQIYSIAYCTFLKRMDRMKEAIHCLEPALKLSNIPPKVKMVMLYGNARILELLGQIDAAYNAYNQMIKEWTDIEGAIDNTPGNGQSYLHIAVAYMKCNKLHLSNNMFDKYLTIKDEDRLQVPYIGVRLRLLWILNKHDEAWIFLTKAIEEKNKDGFVWYYYAVILRQKRDFDESIVAFDKCIDLIDVYKNCEIPSYQENGLSLDL